MASVLTACCLPMVGCTGLGVAASQGLVDMELAGRAVLFEMSYAGGVLAMTGGMMVASALFHHGGTQRMGLRLTLGMIPVVVSAHAVSLPPPLALSTLAGNPIIISLILQIHLISLL